MRALKCAAGVAVAMLVASSVVLAQSAPQANFERSIDGTDYRVSVNTSFKGAFLKCASGGDRVTIVDISYRGIDRDADVFAQRCGNGPLTNAYGKPASAKFQRVYAAVERQIDLTLSTGAGFATVGQ